MRRRKSRSPKGTRAAKSPKRQPWTPRSPSPAPRQRERTGESLRKKLVRWGEELESLVTVFPSRREVHEVVKHVSYVMMAMAATVLLPKIVEHIRVFQDSYFCRGGFLLPVVLASMIWLCASESNKSWASAAFICCSLIAPAILSPHAAGFLWVAGFALNFAIIVVQPEVLVLCPAGTKHYSHVHYTSKGIDVNFASILIARTGMGNPFGRNWFGGERSSNHLHICAVCLLPCSCSFRSASKCLSTSAECTL